MLWLFVIVMIGGLLFVMFRKPPGRPVAVNFLPPRGTVRDAVAPAGAQGTDSLRADSSARIRTAVTQPSMSAIPAHELEQLLASANALRAVSGEIEAPDDDDTPTTAFVPMDFNDIFGRSTRTPTADQGASRPS